jgi:hypothetical protein
MMRATPHALGAYRRSTHTPLASSSATDAQRAMMKIKSRRRHHALRGPDIIDVAIVKTR